MQCFNAIIKGYEEAVRKYNEQIAMENDKAVQIKGSNPGFYRQIENQVLRKNCIAYMIDQNTNARLTFGKSFIKSFDAQNAVSFTNMGVNVTQELDQYAAFVKFFEQAFEWDIMSYYFYPYYWGDRKEWVNIYDFQDNDALFRSFIQSGMARVIVTVRPGFEDAVNFYFKTGMIWNGGEVPGIGEEPYLSLANEMITPTGTPKGNPWRTRIPTPLTILQADSIGLKVEKALPCNCDDNSDFEDTLGSFCNSDPNLGFVETKAQIGGSTTETGGVKPARAIENIDINNGYLQLTTDESPRKIVAQISLEAIKREMNQ
jgi:hypothetical protein